eukprot:6338427-Prorocentrum_lima.AAC.1
MSGFRLNFKAGKTEVMYRLHGEVAVKGVYQLPVSDGGLPIRRLLDGKEVHTIQTYRYLRV